MTLSTVRNNSLIIIVLTVLMLSATAGAQSKDELIKQAQAADAIGNVVGSRDAWCGASKKDSNDSNLKISCDGAQKEYQKLENRSNDNYMLGVGLLQTNDFDGATIKFKNVKAGPRLPDAQARLSEIPKLKADFANKAAAGQQAEKDMETKFNGAVTSFTAGDIPGAKANFQSVNGKHASEAQDYLGKIKNYEAKMNEAGIYASNNDYQSAKKSYTDAAVALGFQPQVVKDKIAELNKLSAANVAPNVPVSNTGNVSTGAKPNVPSAPIIDIGALLAEAQKYMDKKDYSKARQKIVAVLKADIRNKEARDMNDELNKLQPASANTGDEDPILGIYIGQYYKGNYDDAEAALRQYTIASPKKPGLANFYLGLTIVTKYFLGGSSDTERDPKLLNDAKRKFKAAKDVQGFVPPEKLVSPKILQIYKQS